MLLLIVCDLFAIPVFVLSCYWLLAIGLWFLGFVLVLLICFVVLVDLLFSCIIVVFFFYVFFVCCCY